MKPEDVTVTVQWMNTTSRSAVIIHQAILGKDINSGKKTKANEIMNVVITKVSKQKLYKSINR
jgi:hypothetical protein